MRFSKQTGCFYPEDIDYKELPPDLITVRQEDFQAEAHRLKYFR